MFFFLEHTKWGDAYFLTAISEALRRLRRLFTSEARASFCSFTRYSANGEKGADTRSFPNAKYEFSMSHTHTHIQTHTRPHRWKEKRCLVAYQNMESLVFRGITFDLFTLGQFLVQNWLFVVQHTRGDQALNLEGFVVFFTRFRGKAFTTRKSHGK